jgi:RNA polymerase sigma factor (sigma-70 family)
MPNDTAKTENSFELLLNWLDSDRESAAQKYEAIRLRLTKIFYARSCHIAEELTDVTVERVTNKVSELINTYEGDPAIYFYAVAKNVFREWLRKPKPEELPERVSFKEANTDEAELRDRCLTKCMTEISAKQAEFIIEYYQRDKKRKIELRKKLADQMGVSNETLRVRAYRIRNILQKCVLECVGSENM